MARRFIFSQMFDIRPRNDLGELDLEKIRKIEALLDLKLIAPFKPPERVIDLKTKTRPAVIFSGAEEGKKSEESPKEVVGTEKEKKANQFKLMAKARLIEAFLESRLPDREEILAVLEAIERAEQALKEETEAGKEDIVFNVRQPELEQTSQLSAEPVAAISEEPSVVEETFVAPVVSEIEPVKEVFEESAETPSEILRVETKPTAFNSQDKPRIGGSIPVYEDAFFYPEAAEASSLSGDLTPDDFFVNKKIFHPRDPKTWQLTPAQERFLFGRVKPAPTKSAILKTALSSRIFNRKKSIVAFLIAAFLIFSLGPALGWINKALTVKANVLDFSAQAYQALLSAKDSLSQADFAKAENDFSQANYFFNQANNQMNQIGQAAIFILENIPGLTYFSSRIHLVKAGEKLSQSGQYLTQMINLFSVDASNTSSVGNNQVDFSFLVLRIKDYLGQAVDALVSANDHLQKVDIDFLPSEVQGQLAVLKDKLPEAMKLARASLDWADKFLSILGSPRPKKYLLVFQNNAEARATGGFIGSYGILDLNQGRIKSFSVENVFDADGQLIERVVPPAPIQRISTAWSMHDANWFADWPTSAQKIADFYEKTGGATVDGVISFTPAVIERLLALTGPIDLPEYNLTLNADNFVEVTQYKVEVDYDKEANQPKKILADFAPKFIEKLGNQISQKNIEVLKILNQLLKEKHILFYFSDPDLESFVKAQGWAGEVMSAQQDYFSVVNTNINGFKTDKMIDEKIIHTSTINEDGTVVDSLQIIRRHLGGDSPYDWYNRVNSNYSRVYLPKGAELLSAFGQTKEKYQPPIDYQKENFKTDPDVLAQEESMKTDSVSGTQIFEESGKTVFGNWFYVNPRQTGVLTYQYRLPFKIDTTKDNFSFNVLAQKQSGSNGSDFENLIIFPSDWQIVGSDSQNLSIVNGVIKIATDLSLDRKIEVVFKKSK